MRGRVRRRSFLKAGLGTSALLASEGALAQADLPRRPTAVRERKTAIAVIGGGLGGCAAALAALSQGAEVLLSEETDWLGGQWTSQAVPSDEHPWIEHVGNPSYLELRRRIRDYYKRNYPLTAEAVADPLLNPGRGNVSPICCEPQVAAAALEEMLAPFASQGSLTVFLNHKPVAAATNADRIETVTLENSVEGGTTVVHADIFLDATETGELLELGGVEHVTGAESQQETGEPHAPETSDPTNMQSVTWCFPMEYRHGEDHTIDKPEQYDFWKNYVPDLKPPWSGPLLAMEYSHPITLEPFKRTMDPIREGKNEVSGFWRYRRIRYAGHYRPGHEGYDVTLVNWPMNDYWHGPVFGGTEEENRKHLKGAEQLSLSLFYWMQTECPREDGGTGWPGLRLRPDLAGTSNGLAKRPYIRESRRIEALTTVLEQHVGTEARMEETGLPKDEAKAVSFPDSVGLGSYRIDLHPSTGGDNYIDISSLPFEIPLGALIPIRVKNLLPACKNIGTTHVTNGCYRLHPVEWNIGEAAGLFAAWTLEKKYAFEQVQKDSGLLEEFQELLKDRRIYYRWPVFTPR
jgi:hypothetical protein